MHERSCLGWMDACNKDLAVGVSVCVFARAQTHCKTARLTRAHCNKTDCHVYIAIQQN
jgi:hypothetical protein